MLCTRNSDYQLVPGHTCFAGHLSRRTDGCSRQISTHTENRGHTVVLGGLWLLVVVW